MSSITTHSSLHWLVEPIREWCWEGAGGAVGRLINQILKKIDVWVVFLKLYIDIFSNLIFLVWAATRHQKESTCFTQNPLSQEMCTQQRRAKSVRKSPHVNWLTEIQTGESENPFIQ